MPSAALFISIFQAVSIVGSALTAVKLLTSGLLSALSNLLRLPGFPRPLPDRLADCLESENSARRPRRQIRPLFLFILLFRAAFAAGLYPGGS